MKRMIVSSSLTNKGKTWLASSEVDEFVKQMDSDEKKIVGKVSNSTDPKLYLEAVADAVEILGVEVSSAFDSFLNRGLENL